MQFRPTATWPRRHRLFGVALSATTYEQAMDAIIDAALKRRGGVVTHLPVHGVVTAACDPEYRRKVNSFEMVAPDGQPVRWAMKWFRGEKLPDRVYGPELMLRLCQRSEELGIGVYLYGSSPEVVEGLARSLREKFPALRLVGWESPPFRALTTLEAAAAAHRINSSGAGLVFIGLGCPRQDEFAAEHRDAITAVQLCVGAAFDFHAGSKRMAPGWMQRRGLEWLFRLIQEPRRLGRRYLVTNSIFVLLCLRELLRRRPRRSILARDPGAEPVRVAA